MSCWGDHSPYNDGHPSFGQRCMSIVVFLDSWRDFYFPQKAITKFQQNTRAGAAVKWLDFVASRNFYLIENR